MNHNQGYVRLDGSTPRFPDPRDFRLAIVDEPGGIRIRLEFLSPALSSTSMNVRLLIGIESDAWPASTDFPGRVPLGHPDSLLYNEAGQMVRTQLLNTKNIANVFFHIGRLSGRLWGAIFSVASAVPCCGGTADVEL